MSRKDREANKEQTSNEKVRIRVILFTLLLLHALILILLLTRRLDFLFNDAAHRLGPGTDFFAYYNAGKHWLLGQGAYGHGPGFGFRYHPIFAATIGAGISHLHPQAAFAVWVGLQEAAFLLVWRIVWRWLPSARERTVASLLLICFTPYWIELFMGNSSFLVGSLLVFAFSFRRQGRRTWFVLLFTLSVLIKPIGLALLPVVLRLNGRREAAIILFATVATAVPFFLADPESWNRFLMINLRAIPAAGWVVHAGNQGFHGLITDLCARFAGIPTSRLASFGDLPGPCPILLALLPLVFLLSSAIVTLRGKGTLGSMLFLWSATYLLGYKDVWEHSYSFLVLGLGWLLVERLEPKWYCVLTAIWIALPTGFLIYNVDLPPGPIDPEHSWSAAVSIIHHATKSLPLLFLYICVARSILRGKADPPIRLREGSSL